MYFPSDSTPIQKNKVSNSANRFLRWIRSVRFKKPNELKNTTSNKPTNKSINKPNNKPINKPLLVAILFSLLIHALILTLQFGIPGIGMPSIALPWLEKRAIPVPTPLQVRIALGDSKSVQTPTQKPTPTPKETVAVSKIAPANKTLQNKTSQDQAPINSSKPNPTSNSKPIKKNSGFVLVAPIQPTVVNATKKTAVVKKSNTNVRPPHAFKSRTLAALETPITLITQDQFINNDFLVPVTPPEETEVPIRSKMEKLPELAAIPTEQLLEKEMEKSASDVLENLLEKEALEKKQNEKIEEIAVQLALAKEQKEQELKEAQDAQKTQETKLVQEAKLAQAETAAKEAQEIETQKEKLKQELLAKQKQEKQEQQEQLKEALAQQEQIQKSLAQQNKMLLKPVEQIFITPEVDKNEINKARQTELQRINEKELAQIQEEKKLRLEEERQRQQKLALEKIAEREQEIAAQIEQQKQEKLKNEQKLLDEQKRIEQQIAEMKLAEKQAQEKLLADIALAQAQKTKANVIANTKMAVTAPIKEAKGVQGTAGTNQASQNDFGVSGVAQKISKPSIDNLGQGSLADRLREQTRSRDVFKAPLTKNLEENMHVRKRSFFGAYDKEVPLRMYVDSLKNKLERNGNLIYEKRSIGNEKMTLLVNMIVRSDGSVEDVVIVRSSGSYALDEKVKNIIMANAPYAKFPPNVAAKYDVIEVQRVWSFGDNLRIYDELR